MSSSDAPQLANEPQTLLSPRWRAPLVASLFVFVAILALFHSTAGVMVQTWYHFQTYTHGFVILPISLWLIWQERSHLAAFTPQPTPGFLIFVFIGLVVWLLARLTGVLVVEQLAFIGVLISTIAAIIGRQIAWFLIFPLLFLFFAVPMGEDLVPPMMEFTADFTVGAIRLSGIPVYREGLWFSLTSGNWSVVEACSGVRYLIASVTLGVMYAYITYHTLWKRLLFISMSVLVPVLANGVRAYLIVMIGHFSEMEYATGVDHLIYGWIFFGVVMFVLFWIGSFWQETQEPPDFVAPPRSLSVKSVGLRVALVALVSVLASWAVVSVTERAMQIDLEGLTELRAPQGAEGWNRSNQSVAWPAAHQPTTHKIETRYDGTEGYVQLYVTMFPHQRQGNEAISSTNQIADAIVRSERLGSVELTGDDTSFMANRTKVTVQAGNTLHQHLVWQWYRVAGRSLTNRYEGKAWEAVARIWPGRADGAWIALSTPLEAQDTEAAEKRLADFARALMPQVDNAIDAVVANQIASGK